MPNEAAAICDKVGHIMSYGDGWYGGVYVAAMYSLAYVSDDIEYIVSEAEKAGAAVTCTVECGWAEEGIPIPCSAVVRGGLTAAQRAALTDYASQQLGIAEDQIRFEEDVE